MISLFILNIYITLSLVILSIFIGVLFQTFTSKKIKILGDEVRNLQGKMIDIVQISTEGIKSIILYLKKNLFYEKFIFNIKKRG